jgi:hypothetical protein
LLGGHMNNVFGAAGITLCILLLLFLYVMRNRTNNNEETFIVSQSMILHRYVQNKQYGKNIKIKTQSRKYHEKTNIKVIIVDQNAYWVKDNIFYTAPMFNENIDHDLAQEVDTISMDKVQLEQMLFIMDKLREGIDNDSRSSGDE